MFIDSRDLRLLAVQGLTMAEIARELKQPYFRVRKSCQLYGIDVPWDVPGRPPKVKAAKTPRIPKAPKPPRVDPNSERNASIALMYRQGLTLEKIGQTFGLTRERIRQILKRQGITGVDGGQAKVSVAKAAAKRAKQDARCLLRHGMTYEEYTKWRGTPIVAAYRSQENAARKRGIEWGLNFAQWLDIWLTSGKLEQRGRGKGKYLMSRIKDSGGYVVGNVHIQLATTNSLEAVEKWRGKVKAHRGVFRLYPGSSRPFIARVGRKQVGRYATEEEAVQARLAYCAANGLKLRDDGTVDNRKVA